MKFCKEAVIEAIIIGIILIIIGLFVTLLMPKSLEVNLPNECKKWNENHVMELSLFAIGFLFRIGAELSGANEWYVNRWNKLYQK